ncbi:hypothetical protein LTR65_010843 [Meristemomyces frigidus]
MAVGSTAVLAETRVIVTFNAGTAQPPPSAPVPTSAQPSSVVASGNAAVNLPHHEVPAEHLILQCKVHNIDDSSTKPLAAEMYDRGLRTELGKEGRPTQVLTNFLKISHRPNFIFVYKVILVKEWRDESEEGEDKAVYIKRKFDKEALFDTIKASLLRLVNSSCWVTDYDMIWSSKPLFDNKDHHVVPPGMQNISGINPNSFKRHRRRRLDHLPQSHRPGQNLLARGLNAMVTTYARGQANYFAKNANQFYDVNRSKDIDRRLRALSGFFVSVRPGSQQLLLNINLRCSPFLQSNMTVHDFIGKRTGKKALMSVLEGLKVMITYETNPDLTEPERTKFITSIGNVVTQQRLSASVAAASGMATVFDYFSQPIFPHASLKLDKSSFAINVGADPFKKRSKKGNGKKKDGDDADEPEWYPSQYLEIVGFPSYRQQLQGYQTAKMLKAALKMPVQHIEEISDKGMNMFGLRDRAFTARLEHDFGLIVKPELSTVPCRIIAPPVVEYGDKTNAKITLAAWNLQRMKLASTCTTAHVPILDLTGLPEANVNDDNQSRSEFERAGQFPRDFPGILQQEMVSLGLPRGVVDPNPHAPDYRNEDDFNLPDERMELFLTQLISCYGNVDPRDMTIVIVIPKTDYELYATIKRVAELKMGLKTVCCAASKMTSWYDKDSRELIRRVAAQHCANIALKLNIKGECDNHRISSASFAELYRVGAEAGVIAGKNPLTEADTIVLGADVTHPMGNCAPGCPSIAAVVGSVDDRFAHFPGSMRLQRSRQEVITELQHMVKERLVDWARRHGGRLPGSVLFYRDGVSESFYEKVRTEEIPLIKEAYDLAYDILQKTALVSDVVEAHGDVADAGPNDNTSTSATGKHDKTADIDPASKASVDKIPAFKLTFVIVGKGHNTRFYALPGNVAQDTWISKKGVVNGNIMPGCVVDQTVTHPSKQISY